MRFIELGLCLVVTTTSALCSPEMLLNPKTTTTSSSLQSEEALASEYVIVSAGATLDLAIDPGQHGVLPGGNWKAQDGTFLGSIYTAPSFLPPEGGVDRIEYTAPNGYIVLVEVRVMPAKAIPSSNQYRVVRRSRAAGDLRHDQLLYDRLAALETGATVIVLGLNEPSPEEFGVGRPIDIPRTRFRSSLGYRLPSALFSEVDDPVIFARAGTGSGTALAPKKARLVPYFPHLRPSDPGVVPPTQREVSRSWRRAQVGGWQDLGEISVPLKRELGGNGLPRHGSRGESQTTWRGMAKMRDVTWRERKRADVYECRNGTWVLVRKTDCVRLSAGMLTTPEWYALTQGYPANGDPNLWTSWGCSEVSLP